MDRKDWLLGLAYGFQTFGVLNTFIARPTDRRRAAMAGIALGLGFAGIASYAARTPVPIVAAGAAIVATWAVHEWAAGGR